MLMKTATVNQVLLQNIKFVRRHTLLFCTMYVISLYNVCMI